MDLWQSTSEPWTKPKPLVQQSPYTNFWRHRGGVRRPFPSNLRRLAGNDARWQADYRVILREQDGCPWFGHKSAMPVGWGWEPWFGLMTDRYIRMKDWCNGEDDTEDIPITIYIFCIIVACAIICVVTDGEAEAEFKKKAKKRLGEFLDIPMLAERFDGCRLVIVHMHHGQQMLTGVDPDKLTDLDIDKCNCLIESTASIYIKHNYPESQYRDIKRCIQSVDPAKLRSYGAYDPEAPDPGTRVALQEIADFEEDLTIEDLLKEELDVEDELGEEREGYL